MVTKNKWPFSIIKKEKLYHVVILLLDKINSECRQIKTIHYVGVGRHNDLDKYLANKFALAGTLQKNGISEISYILLHSSHNDETHRTIKYYHGGNIYIM